MLSVQLGGVEPTTEYTGILSFWELGAGKVFYIALAVLELTEILLSLLPKCLD